MSHLPPGAWRMNVAAIIMDDAGHVLLGSPGAGKRYHFPQGGVKSGEALQSALLREVQEEVGLSGCRILAEYAGLRYTYRRKNEKSKRWQGQQQTYYLLHCPGVKPPVDCTQSAEFATAEWLPLEELRPELFASFKREVVMQALGFFFPPGSSSAHMQELPTRCTALRYLHSPRQPLLPPAATYLFAGKREEALYHLVHTAPLRLRKKQRLLVILIGMEGCGIKKCLRHIAHSVDPLATRYHLYPKSLAEASPAPGEISFVALRPQEVQPQLFCQFEEQQAQEGACVIKIALHLSKAKQLRRLASKEDTPSTPWADQLHTLLAFADATSAHRLWYALPAEHGWYRDFVLLNILSSAIH